MKINSLKKNTFITVVALVLVFCFGVLGNYPQKASAQNTTGNVSGYAWSSNIGWVSFNCHQGGTNGGDICGTSAYSVNVDSSTGIFSGFAWSSNIGWISFNSGDVATQCGSIAKLTGTTVSGWARAIAGSQAQGWDGCINFSGTNPNYGVVYNATSHTLTGYAWGSTVVGWIGFTNTTLNLGNGNISLTANNQSSVTLAPTGGPLELEWSVQNNPGPCTASNDFSGTDWTGNVTPLAGAQAVTSGTNSTTSNIVHTYTLTCGTDSASVAVTLLAPGASNISFVGTDTTLNSPQYNQTGPNVSVVSGDTVKFVWSTISILSCSGQSAQDSSFNGSKQTNPDGSYSFVATNITANRTYTLTNCLDMNSNPVSDQSVNITVLPSPGATCHIVPTGYQYSDFNVNNVQEVPNLVIQQSATSAPIDITRNFQTEWDFLNNLAFPSSIITAPAVSGITPTVDGGNQSHITQQGQSASVRVQTNSSYVFPLDNNSNPAPVNINIVGTPDINSPAGSCTPAVVHVVPAGYGVGQNICLLPVGYGGPLPCPPQPKGAKRPKWEEF